MPRFSTSIYKIGINPVVDPPDPVMKIIFAEAGKSAGPIPVRGKLNGVEFVQTLVKYQGAWRLYINGPMLKASGLQVGDTAKIQLEFDAQPRTVPVPAALAVALRNDKNAASAFAGLSPSRRKEILRYIGSLKTQESVDKNVARVLRHLRGEEVDQALARSKRGR